MVASYTSTGRWSSLFIYIIVLFSNVWARHGGEEELKGRGQGRRGGRHGRDAQVNRVQGLRGLQRHGVDGQGQGCRGYGWRGGRHGVNSCFKNLELVFLAKWWDRWRFFISKSLRLNFFGLNSFIREISPGLIFNIVIGLSTLGTLRAWRVWLTAYLRRPTNMHWTDSR